jgi:hypothetical protein
MPMRALLPLLLLLASPVGASADSFSLGISAGTPGAGVELGFAFDRYWEVRLQDTSYSRSLTSTQGRVPYSINLQLQSYGALIDYRPFAGVFRVTGGLEINENSARAIAVSQSSYVLNGNTYTAAQTGTLDGRVSFRRYAPYVGLGWSSLRSADEWGFGVSFDLGFLDQGAASVSLTATGTSANDHQFQSDLAAEQATIKDNISRYKLYPVAAFGVQYRF